MHLEDEHSSPEPRFALRSYAQYQEINPGFVAISTSWRALISEGTRSSISTVFLSGKLVDSRDNHTQKRGSGWRVLAPFVSHSLSCAVSLRLPRSPNNVEPGPSHLAACPISCKHPADHLDGGVPEGISSVSRTGEQLKPRSHAAKPILHLNRRLLAVPLTSQICVQTLDLCQICTLGLNDTRLPSPIPRHVCQSSHDWTCTSERRRLVPSRPLLAARGFQALSISDATLALSRGSPAWTDYHHVPKTVCVVRPLAVLIMWLAYSASNTPFAS